eukprot:s909_g2.t1
MSLGDSICCFREHEPYARFHTLQNKYCIQMFSSSTFDLTHKLNQSCSTKRQMSTAAVASSGTSDAMKRMRKMVGPASDATEAFVSHVIRLAMPCCCFMNDVREGSH